MKSGSSSARTLDLANLLCNRFRKMFMDWVVDPDRYLLRAISLVEMVSIEELPDRCLTGIP